VARTSRWLALGLIALGSAMPTSAEEGEPKVVKDGSQVSIEYTLKLDDGSIADTSEGREPLRYEQGAGQILPGLEESLSELAVGDEREITLTPENGYGLVQDDLYQTVEIERIPEDARKAGTLLMAQDDQGNQQPLRVHEVREDVVVIDMNHPLAGKTLHFAVKVVSID